MHVIRFRHTAIQSVALAFGLAASAVLSACGGGSSNTAGTPALSVMSTSPANAATGVSRDANLLVNFSAGLDAATATGANISLTQAGNNIPLALSVAGSQLTATPVRKLLPLATYTLQVGAGLRGRSGERLAGVQSVTFTTADGAWKTAQLIESGNGHAADHQVTADASGNALAVWSQSDGTRWHIWANRLTAGTGWGVAQMIETNTNGDAEFPQIAIDTNGNALAVWSQSDGTRTSIWANRFTADAGWGTAQSIATDNTGDAQSPQIAIDASGNALAVWEQSDGIRNNIWANRYTVSGGWGSAQVIETDNTGDAQSPQIAIDASGNALVVWEQSDGMHWNIWANRYTVGGGWGNAQLIETNNAGDAVAPQIAIAASGNALVVWAQSDGTHWNIWANRYTVGGGWSAAQIIDGNNARDAETPQIAIDASGNALAVWAQSDGTRTNIWANRYAVSSGWGTAQLIETDNAGDAQTPQIAIDGSGNALAVWAQSDNSRNNIWANRYTVSAGWGTAQLIETDNAGDAELPKIAIGGSGNGQAVWKQYDGTRWNIWANSFD